MYSSRIALAIVVLTSAAACTGPNPAFTPVMVDAGPVPPDGRMQATGDVNPGETMPPTAAPDSASLAEVSPGPPDGAADVSAMTDPDADPPADAAPDLPPDTPDAPPAAPAEGLVGHFEFEAGTAATVGTGSATLRNGAAWVTDAPPTAGPNTTSVRLDGNNDYVDLPVGVCPRAEAPKTIALWFRNQSTSPRLRNMIAMFHPTLDAGVQLGWENDRVAWWRYGDEDPIITARTATTDQGWHHAAYTYDGTRHRLYVDGVEEGTSTVSLAAGEIQVARLGTYDGTDEMFTGQLDELRIYDRALSPADIVLLAQRF